MSCQHPDYGGILIKVCSNINVTWHLFTDSDLNIQSFPKIYFSPFRRQKGRCENVNKKIFTPFFNRKNEDEKTRLRLF